MTALLVSLALLFGELSLLAFGGGNAVLPEMQRQVVEIHHWMSAQEFSSLFALAQAAPGPNLMIVPLIGWHLAGLPGLLVSSAAKFIPSGLLAACAFRLWERHSDRPWRKVVQGGLVPMTAGLVCASAAIITEAVATSLPLIAITIVSSGLMAFTRLHPIVLLAGGALVGLAL
ncbi:chromate transporter [Rhizobium halophytocola]|uniref:Chromate transporter n=1 Tax=Rhizobium halophytocola TaxID=735519 RepID=A0ABS4E0I9_9HYPH|nr:chromate transporter [Rhizobium halophytocola]MBP1851454.1 chromate transporter [Rhizobium halophytocola]